MINTAVQKNTNNVISDVNKIKNQNANNVIIIITIIICIWLIVQIFQIKNKKNQISQKNVDPNYYYNNYITKKNNCSNKQLKLIKIHRLIKQMQM
jgi:hypothetical protein